MPWAVILVFLSSTVFACASLAYPAHSIRVWTAAGISNLLCIYLIMQGLTYKALKIERNLHSAVSSPLGLSF